MLRDLIIKFYKAIKALVTRRIVLKCDRIPHQFYNVPLKKILNWIRVEVSVFRKPERPWGWPTHLQIEPTTFCNLRCALCPITKGMNRTTGHMDFNLFKKIIDEVGDYIFLILLWDWGEPFINPSIYDMISYAKEKQIKVVSSTNGHIFAQKANADKLIKSGLDTLVVATDGISQDTYERYRQRGDLELVFQAIRTIIERKRVLKSATPLVNLRFIPMKHNEHEIPKLNDLAKSLGVDALTIRTLNPYSNDTYGLKRSVKDGSEDEFLPKDHRYRRFKYASDGVTPIRVQKNPCKNLWHHPTIHWDGGVCSCTYDYNEKFIFGDLKTDAFKDIWFGTPYRKIRRQFRLDWEKINTCGNCSYAYQGGNCIDETITEAFFFNHESPAKVNID